MLNESKLKDWLHRDLKQIDKLLLVLATYDAPASVSQIRDRAKIAGLKIPTRWNVSSMMSRSNGLAIRVPAGWEITEAGRNYLVGLGLVSGSHAAERVATDLRTHLNKIKNPATRAFAEEAIKCHEAQLFRSAIVMSWLAAVDVLYREVVGNHLAAFNTEAKKTNVKWKDAVNEDGLGRMGEEDFLNRIAAIGTIGKNQKEELLKGLKLRNGCGHPNSLKVGPNVVASHIEILLLNVFEQFDV